jgi:carbamoyltransferase
MIVLGINEDHNASAAVVKDGEVVAAASEERFTRLKNDVGYPREAVEEVLKVAGLRPEDCDQIVCAGREQDPVQLKIKRVGRYTTEDYVREMHDYWKPVLLEKRPSNYWEEIQKDPRLGSAKGVYYNFDFMTKLPPDQWNTAFAQERKQTASRHLGVSAEKVSFIDHHPAHAHYAYFAAPIDRSRKTAVVTADGWGDGCNASISLAQGNTLREVHRTANCHLARLYRWTTLILGLKPNEHEYKVMGLAPYAKEYVKRAAYNIYKETLVVDGLDFKWNKQPPDSYFYFRDRFERKAVRFDGIAGGIQDWLEEMLAEWVTNILRALEVDQLVFSGGLALNVKANKVLAELPGVRSFYVAGSGGDESLCIGSAFAAANGRDEIKPIGQMYFGPALDAAETAQALQAYHAAERFELVANPTAGQIADLLVQGKVIARCIGQMEFGARALGNRSILCDPSNWENVRKINEMVKSRDFWMPFAPTILLERAHDYLENPKDVIAPFMTIGFDTTPLARKHLIAALHPYDFTARPQVLDKDTNPGYYDIIKAFEARTGIGAVLNTSFNLHGEPIVNNTADAMHTFVDSGLDGLLLPDVLLLKKEQP